MFGWLRFGRSRKSGHPATSEEPIVSPGQIDLPTPEQRQLLADYVNSGNAVFGVVDGSREFEAIDSPKESGLRPQGSGGGPA